MNKLSEVVEANQVLVLYKNSIETYRGESLCFFTSGPHSFRSKLLTLVVSWLSFVQLANGLAGN